MWIQGAKCSLMLLLLWDTLEGLGHKGGEDFRRMGMREERNTGG